MTNIKMALICGGPSAERGISLNSARSVMDHMQCLVDQLTIYYVTQALEVHQLSKQVIYSNTPEDFDYLLDSSQAITTQNWLIALAKLDVVFSVIHGPYGEDGELQQLLEQGNINYVGSTAKACNLMFHKERANQFLNKIGYTTLPSTTDQSHIEQMLQVHQELIIKPVAGGSSLGVHQVCDLEEAQLAIDQIKSLYHCDVLIEPFCRGIEFTIVILMHQQIPIALVPTEIELLTGGVYDYRKKYLPTATTRLHCPPRFSAKLISRIRNMAVEIFNHFGMRDFARLDGWVVGDQIIFSDFNPISGLEQNSFVFIQASRFGLSHQQVLTIIINQALQRVGKEVSLPHQPAKKILPILLGGNSTERQVSLMSGVNVYLKLLSSSLYQPKAYLLDENHQVWPLSLSHLLNHTVEEIQHHLKYQQSVAPKLLSDVRSQLGYAMMPITTAPKPISLNAFVSQLESRLFLALHGGIGEDGTIQNLLTQHAIAFNGSDALVAKLAMDKYAFASFVNQLNLPYIRSLAQKQYDPSHNASDYFKALSSKQLIAKPRSEGCSQGIMLITSASDLARISSHVDYILEPYIQTDNITVLGHDINHIVRSGWVELTVVVWQEQSGYSAKPPSLSVATKDFLSLEEKFQGGTGINFTPPPKKIVTTEQVRFIQQQLESLAAKVKLKDYARFDIFFNHQTNHIIVIEMNTLPALTPSTVLFHQMLACEQKRTPLQVIEFLCNSACS